MSYYGNEIPEASADVEGTNEQGTSDPLEQAEISDAEIDAGDALKARVK
jgi:hypothetical protein